MPGYSRLPATVLTLSVVAAATVASVTACTKHEQSNDQAAAASASAPAPAPTRAPDTVTVTARDFAFDAPSEIPAGVTVFHELNRGKEFHHVQLVKFNEGKTLADLLAALKAGGPPPAWMVEVGGPNAPAPGADANATVTLDPGNYAFVCFVDVPDHIPHIMKGMSKAFTVVPSATASAAEPASDVTITLSDYAFTTSKPLTAGPHVIRVENSAGQPHEVEVVQLAPGKTADEVLTWINDPKGPPPGRPLGGMAALAPGRYGFFSIDLAPGRYALICFLPDMKDGKPHFMHGMKTEFSVS